MIVSQVVVSYVELDEWYSPKPPVQVAVSGSEHGTAVENAIRWLEELRDRQAAESENGGKA